MVYLTDTRMNDAKASAESLRKRIEEGLCNSDHEVTVRQGVVAINNHETFEQMFKKADQGLLKAKDQGFKRVCIE